VTLEILPVSRGQVEELQRISQETFFDTFEKYNDAANLLSYMEQNYCLEKLIHELDNKESFLSFVYDDNQLVAYMKLNIDSAQSEELGTDSLEIERIYVRKKFKRLGIGKRLLEYALECAQQKNKTFIWLGVWEYNLEALNFYEKMGFACFSEHTFKVGQEKQRDLLMKKVL